MANSPQTPYWPQCVSFIAFLLFLAFGIQKCNEHEVLINKKTEITTPK